ncbi:hypothetical protein RFI_33512, partial [Reticulomyxa filosa]
RKKKQKQTSCDTSEWFGAEKRQKETKMRKRTEKQKVFGDESTTKIRGKTSQSPLSPLFPLYDGKSESNVIPFVKHMTLTEAQQLRISDVVDHRDSTGRYQLSKVLDIDQKGYLSVKCAELNDKCHYKSHISKHLH